MTDNIQTELQPEPIHRHPDRKPSGTISSRRRVDQIRYRPTSDRVQSRRPGSLYQGHQEADERGIH